MAGHDTIRRDGGWTVELVTPLRATGGAVVDKIDMRPAELGHVIRWGDGSIPSTLAMLSELSGVDERLLRTLSYPDVDRVLLAYSQVVPAAVRKDFEEGSRPFSTPDDQLPAPVYGEQPVVPADPIDPRFPRVEGPVERYVKPPGLQPSPLRPQPPQMADEEADMAADPPNVARRVG